MTPTSPTGTEHAACRRRPGARRRGAGFTIIELLIVITLVATLTAILVPTLAPSPTRLLREAASNLSTTLRETRRHAQADQVRRRFLIDVDSHRYGIDQSSVWQELPEGVTAQLTTAESLLTSKSVGGIDFFPDGSSTGGRVVLALDEHSLRVDIEWLTGRIRVRGIDE